MGEKFDFTGWATKHNIKCADGRTIKPNAFSDCDGMTVPLVWNHRRNDMENVLGHALLENRPEGVYAFCSFNDTPEGQRAKTQVIHGDITALSIYANQLVQRAGDVLHGLIREVSLVPAGANPGAWIDNVLTHSDSHYEEDEGVFYNDEEGLIMHSDNSDEEENENDHLEHASNDSKEETNNENQNGATSDSKEKTIGDVIETMNEEQKNVLYALVGAAQEESNNKQEDNNMKHSAFDVNAETEANELMHTGLDVIIKDGKRCGTLKESFLEHSAEYGIENIDWLFPDAKNLSNAPSFIKRTPDSWVQTVMNGVHHTPFSRIKMVFADLREDDARAKGYAKKGKLKKEEVFGLIKRVIDPTTIYKKQKMDRDDKIDITDFDVVSWLKAEMRMMLDEEIARAIVFGDGRSVASEDKIDPTKIIPIVSDAALYTIVSEITVPQGGNLYEEIVDGAVIAQDDYEGSGNTKCFMPQNIVTRALLLKDKDGHRMYKDVKELALAMSVNEIVKVPASIVPEGIYGVIVDLNDYNVGADKGGSINLFEDFDIDYNQEKYLIETRCSGALTKPFSAIVLKAASDSNAQG